MVGIVQEPDGGNLKEEQQLHKIVQISISWVIEGRGWGGRKWQISLGEGMWDIRVDKKDIIFVPLNAAVHCILDSVVHNLI